MYKIRYQYGVGWHNVSYPTLKAMTDGISAVVADLIREGVRDLNVIVLEVPDGTTSTSRVQA